MKQLVIGESFEEGIKHRGLGEKKLRSRDLGAIKLPRICPSRSGCCGSQPYNSAPLRLIPFAGKRDNRMLYEWFVVEVASWSIRSDWAGPKKILNQTDTISKTTFHLRDIILCIGSTLEYRYHLHEQTFMRVNKFRFWVARIRSTISWMGGVNNNYATFKSQR